VPGGAASVDDEPPPQAARARVSRGTAQAATRHERGMIKGCLRGASSAAGKQVPRACEKVPLQ
jgi:hypothetical protein